MGVYSTVTYIHNTCSDFAFSDQSRTRYVHIYIPNIRIYPIVTLYVMMYILLYDITYC